MNGLVHVRSFRSKLRAPDDAGLRRCRAVQGDLLDAELEAALARLAPADEVVVVRRLRAQIRLQPGRSDRDNARRWSDGLALALAEALQQHAPARDLLRFRQRRHALLAFVTDALAGATERDWAWQRLGLLPAGEAVSTRQRRDALLRLLADDARDADAGVPVLRALLGTSAWPALIAQLSDGELRGLAGSVLWRIGDGAGGGFDAAAAPGAVDSTVPAAADDTAPGTAPAAAPWLAATARAAVTPQRARWALRLALMLQDPVLARRGAAAVDAALALALSPGPVPARSDDAAPQPAPAARGEATATSSATPDRAPAAAPIGAPADAAVAGAALPVTAFGGVLLLLPLLEPCGILAMVEDAALWPATDGGLRLALHRLALRLQPMADADPAALAFCGLAPDADPPAAGLAPTPAQQAALDAARERLLAELAERLPDWRGAGLLGRVVCRRATIRHDPGWIDVSFSLRDVSTQLRRAALDLDPGFIAWLGLVLRFHYE